MAASCRMPSSVSRRFAPRILDLWSIQKAEGTLAIERSVPATAADAPTAEASRLARNVGCTYLRQAVVGASVMK